MIVWAVANQKGGVGKTTTVVSLGGWAARQGERTLLVDFDPHGSMTAYFGLNPDSIERSAYLLFQKKGGASVHAVPDLILPTRFDNLSLLPASTAMATLDRQLGAEDGMGLTLKRALESIKSRYDRVIIDCPPLLGVLMVNALAACDHLVVPVQTEFLALKGLERMLRTVTMVSRALRKEVAYTIVPTMFDRRTRASLATLRLLRERYPDQMWQSVIPVDTQFREASRVGIPLPIRSPTDRGSQSYHELLQALDAPQRQPEPLAAVAP